ncbi:ABC transporter ATP-binding protein [Streptomyces subrutilus]|uniref:Multidrug ABC transporter ATP-binding protein n=1 Tax=Streptomyces subrutilus TaxID=36818 RepID=A0A1E5PZ70_9ACTN|nr:ABC transporter ATP-binding protein [Streptomyces subrutilus]OEJ34720.1 multidrug ABC transporter ATP-binding protein [Streptomyces subrutilus]
MSLPVADAKTVRRHVRGLVRSHTGLLTRTVLWFVLATVCGLVVPALLGRLVGEVEKGITTDQVDITVALIAGLLLLQGVFTRTARLQGARLGELVLADIREGFVRRVLTLPLRTVEKAGAGDLLTRSTRDVDSLSNAVRMGAPSILVASLSVGLTLVALVVTSPIMVLPCLIAVPLIVWSTRWYLTRAREAYLAEAATYSDLAQGLSETVTGARTVESLHRSGPRIRRTDEDVVRANGAERRTLFLRSVWFPLMDFGYVLPVAATLLFGGLFYIEGWVSLGEVTAATLYTRAVIDPLDELLGWLDELQVGDASLARLIGVKAEAGPESGSGRRPEGDRLAAEGVAYAYRTGHDVIEDVSLSVGAGERIAIVGPSGAGKSTLGRILAGIHEPRTGSVTLGGVPVHELPLEELRRHVALVTQEHHVFLGTVRENVALAAPDATDEQVTAALAAVAAEDWVRALPAGLDTELGTEENPVSPGQAQQLALARLVLADPHTLVLDEATSLLDPRAARDLERSLAGVLRGRTVIAIAHRLHTAHDADRVVVMEAGRITEQGAHDELVSAGGAYAGLWESWHGRGAAASPKSPAPSPSSDQPAH